MVAAWATIIDINSPSSANAGCFSGLGGSTLVKTIEGRAVSDSEI